MGAGSASTMVSARVPKDLCDQVNEMLQSAGATATQLIVGAYRQFRDTGELPGQEKPLAPGKRVLAGKQYDDLIASVKDTTALVPEEYFAGVGYDDIIEQELRARYEALA